MFYNINIKCIKDYVYKCNDDNIYVFNKDKIYEGSWTDDGFHGGFEIYIKIKTDKGVCDVQIQNGYEGIYKKYFETVDYKLFIEKSKIEKIKEVIINYFKDINTPKIDVFNKLVELGVVNKKQAILNLKSNKESKNSFNVNYYNKNGYTIVNGSHVEPLNTYNEFGKDYWNVTIITIRKDEPTGELKFAKRYTKEGIYVIIDDKCTDYEFNAIVKNIHQDGLCKTEILYRSRFKNILKIIY